MNPKNKWKLMDIHTHILPGVDDGASSMKETMRMLQMAEAEGISVIIATPHYGRRNPDYDPENTKNVLTVVRDMMKKCYPNMKIYMGNEIYYSPGIVEDLKCGRAKTIGGTSYALIEFSVHVDYSNIENAVNMMTREGYKPILAHIERYQCLYKEPEKVRGLIAEGAYMQVNTRGFLGSRFDKRTAWCRSLLQNGLIHFVASDCHNDSSRAPIMNSAVEEMVKIAGKDEVKRIVNTNIIKLIKNEFI